MKGKHTAIPALFLESTIVRFVDGGWKPSPKHCTQGGERSTFPTCHISVFVGPSFVVCSAHLSCKNRPPNQRHETVEALHWILGFGGVRSLDGTAQGGLTSAPRVWEAEVNWNG